MAPRRREFLKLAAGVPLLARASPRQPAHDLVRRACLGPVVFCRVSQPTLEAALATFRLLFDEAEPISISGPTLRYPDFVAAYEASDQRQLVICGAKATLVVDQRGYRRFA